MEATTAYEAALTRVKDLINSATAGAPAPSTVSSLSVSVTTTSKAPVVDVVVLKTLFALLSSVLEEIASTPDAVLLANANLSIMEDVVTGKGSLVLSESIQSLCLSFYSQILLKRDVQVGGYGNGNGSSSSSNSVTGNNAGGNGGVTTSITPGYAVRNVMTSMLAIASGKNTLSTSRECAVNIIGMVMEARFIDCGSMANDVITCLIKIIKGSDVAQRVAAFRALAGITSGAGSRLNDCYAEIVKIAGKYTTDKSIEVRIRVAKVLEVVARNSNITAEVLLGSAVKGLEDEVAEVQDAFAIAVSAIFHEQIRVHYESLEQAKAAAARGGSSSTGDGSSGSNGGSGGATPKKKVGMMSRMSITQKIASSVSTTKKVVDDYAFRSVISHIVKQILSSKSVILRASYTIVLHYLITDCLLFEQGDGSIGLLDASGGADFEWLILTCLSLLKEPPQPQNHQLTFEEFACFRTRVSHLFRAAMVANLTESRLLVLSSILSQFVSSIENRGEQELHLALSELSHVVSVLGEASVAVLDDIHGCAMVHLRHSAFAVRSAAAQVLTSLATAVPSVAAGFLRNSLQNAQAQSKQLSTEGGASSQTEAPSEGPFDETSADGGNAGGVGKAVATDSSRRKSAKETERLQRMYFFHGHTLVVSFFIKNAHNFPSGLPKTLIWEIFDFGLELLGQDVQAASPPIRHVVCSIVRAGSLIVSSCLNMGYSMSRTRISFLLAKCHDVFSQTNAPTTSVTPATGDDCLYELMCIEAALVCISTLLWSCPEALIQEDGCILLVVEGLEMAFHALKGKYQPKFRAHFRFRTLHAILLECFAWLPPGSFPGSCQQLFVEALRVFRDCIAGGFECTCLSDFMPDDFDILYMPSSQSAVAGKPTAATQELPLSELSLILKLENNSIVLQKKESEAFLSSFSHDNSSSDFVRISLQSAVEWSAPSAPVAHIDSRTLDASIALLATTFGHQENDYQEKAIQLCSQALSQVSKVGSSLGMFSSDDEKRRKEKKSYVTIKNVVALFSSLVKAFSMPLSVSLNLSISWGQAMADRMFEMLTHPNVEIRCCAAESIAIFGEKVAPSSLLQTAYGHISTAMTSALEKKGDPLTEYAGYMITLSSLWIHCKGPSKVALRKNIVVTVFECLRKADCSTTFRTHGILSLAIIMEGMHKGAELAATSTFSTSASMSSSLVPPLNTTSYLLDASELAELPSLVERVCHIAELHLVGITTFDDSLSLLIALQRLVNATLSVIKFLNSQRNAEKEKRTISQPASPSFGSALLTASSAGFGATFPDNGSSNEASDNKSQYHDYLVRLYRMWELIRKLSPHPLLQKESLIFVARTFEDASFSSSIPRLKTTEVILNLRWELENVHSSSSSSPKRFMAALDCIERLMQSKSNISLLIQEDIDLLLFELLDWCVSSNTASISSSYSGLELRCGNKGLEAIIGDMKSLHLKVEGMICSLAMADVIGISSASPKYSGVSGNGNALTQSGLNSSHSVDVRLTRWVLLCRAIALGLRSSGNSEDEGDGSKGRDRGGGGGGGRDDDEEGDGDGDGTSAASGGGGAGDGGGSGKGVSGNNPFGGPRRGMTYQQYVTWCRDEATQRSQSLSATRLRVKCLAIRCMNQLLSAALMDQPTTNPAHLDLHMGRQATRNALQSLGQAETPSDAVLSTLPCFLSLFMHDVVNMACACATYTMEDKRVVTLQTESTMLLHKMLHLFWNAVDPDQISTSGHPMTSSSSSSSSSLSSKGNDNEPIKMILQFMSQLVSAVRPNLSVTHCAILLQNAGVIVCDLVHGGFLTDKVAIRRLIKAIIAFAEDKDGQSLQPRARESPDVSETVSTVDHIIGAELLARLYLLSKDTSVMYDEVEKSVKSTLSAALQEFIPRLSAVWYGIIIDTARVMQRIAKPGDDSSSSAGSSPGHGGGEASPTSMGSGQSNFLTSGATLAYSAHKCWSLESKETDPRRGGIVYSSLADTDALRYYFNSIFPVVCAACSHTPSLKSEQINAMFAVCQSALQHEALGLTLNGDDDKKNAEAWNRNKAITSKKVMQEQIIHHYTQQSDASTTLKFNSKSQNHAGADCLKALPFLLEAFCALSSSEIDTAHSIPVTAWCGVLSFIAAFVTGSSTEGGHFHREITTIATNLLNRFKDSNGANPSAVSESLENMEERDYLLKVLWKHSMLSLVTFTPSLFSIPSESITNNDNDNDNDNGQACPSVETITSFVLSGNTPKLTSSLRISNAMANNTSTSSTVAPFAASFDTPPSSSSPFTSSTSTSTSTIPTHPLNAVDELTHFLSSQQHSVNHTVSSIKSVINVLTNLAICQSQEHVTFTLNYLTILAPVIALSLENDASLKSNLLEATFINIVKLSQSKLPSSANMSIATTACPPSPQAIVGDVMNSYLQASIILASTNSMTNDKIFSLCNTAMETLLSISRSIFMASDASSISEMPIQISAGIMQHSAAPLFVRALLTSSLRIMQMQATTSHTGDALKGTNYSKNLMQALIPSILCVLSGNNNNGSSGNSSSTSTTDLDTFELLAVQLILFSFNFVDETRRAAMIELILPILCQVMMKNSIDSPIVQFCGKGVTHLARSFPEIFRVQVTTLSESARNTLMEVMRNVQLQQQQQQQQQGAQSQAPQSSSLSSGPKKIDFTKFKS